MKKSLIATTAAMAACGAMAQSSITLFGVVDVALQRAHQGPAGATRLTGVGGNQFSRIGVRGAQDIGGGLSAGFVLDAGLNVDSGSGAGTSTNNQASGTTTASAGTQGLTFNRRSTVSLISRTWGEVRLGRDFVPTYWNLTVFDPFGTAGAGSANNLAQSALTRVSTVSTAVRASNTVGYFLPTRGGVYGQAMYAMGENPSDAPAGASRDGNYAGFRVGYATGPVNVAASHGQTTLASGDVRTSNAAASYQFGPAKLMAQYFRDSKDSVAAPSKSRGWLFGAQLTVGAGYVPVSYATIKDNSSAGRSATQVAIGYVHHLSRRTALYTTYSRIQNKNGAAITGGGVPGVANEAWSGIDVGISHSF